MLALLAALLLGALLTSCLGPGLEPPSDRASSGGQVVVPRPGSTSSDGGTPAFGNPDPNTGTDNEGPLTPGPEGRQDAGMVVDPMTPDTVVDDDAGSEPP